MQSSENMPGPASPVLPATVREVEHSETFVYGEDCFGDYLA